MAEMFLAKNLVESLKVSLAVDGFAMYLKVGWMSADMVPVVDGLAM